jgi:hypothetical protein
MPRLVGFSRFDALLEEQIDEKISRRVLSGDHGLIVWWSMGAGVPAPYLGQEGTPVRGDS